MSFFNFTDCRVCGTKVSPEHEKYARSQIMNAICGNKCHHVEKLKRYACCDKAVETMCVCTYSTECPDHGQRCHGTHD